MAMINQITDNKKAQNLGGLGLIEKSLGQITMPTIASPEPEPQDPSPKQFRKDNMQADLKAAASKFDEMANLFSIIKTLLEQNSPHAASQVKQLAETGMDVCVDWSFQVERMESHITKEDRLYFH